jgi:hypothetical protein
VIVVGAGMAGLLAAGMLRGDCEAVYEAQESLPNNHSAVLRFRSSVVGDALNIRFKEVQAIKSVEPWKNPIADALSYSVKTNGTATLRSVLSADAAPKTRFIAPPDMIQQMADRVSAPISFGNKRSKSDWSANPSFGIHTISTLPMPLMMEALGWKARSEFRSREGFNVGCKLNGVDAYCSLYVPDPTSAIARISITGDQLVAECYGQPHYRGDLLIEEAIRKMGLSLVYGKGHNRISTASEWEKTQQYAKILPIDEDERREFIMWASREFNVYLLGRYATWRPHLLLDDLVNDVRVIQRLSTQKGASYAHKLKGKS